MSELTSSAIKKLKVAELRAELTKRGLDVKGKKDELVSRLVEAVGLEASQSQESTEGDSEAVDSQEVDSQEEENEKEEQDDDGEKAVEQEETTEQDEEMQAAEETETSAEKENNDEVAKDKEDEEMKAEDTDNVAETEEPTESKQEAKQEAEEDAEKMDTGAAEVKEPSKSEKVDHPEKKDERRREESRKREHDKKPESKKEEEKPVEELQIELETEENEVQEELEVAENAITLDTYTSDLTFMVGKDGVSGRNLIKNGFGYLWHGIKANKGIKGGKVCFECKFVKKLEVDLPDSEVPKHGLRVGWSANSSGLQLGEAKLSYGYESTGKICASSNFSDYAQPFDEGDVIGAYLDLESDPKTLKYTKNGEDQGIAMSLNLNLDGKALFPHLLVKNVEVEVNFGVKETPWFQPLEDYNFIQSVGDESLLAAPSAPAEKKDCEVLMMVGLPAAGKTHWTQKYTNEHDEKQYNVLGTNVIYERMKLQGQRRKRDADGFDKLVEAMAKILSKLLLIAPTRRRNYIIDQTNVYSIVQKKKMEQFSGFKRVAVCVIPTHDNLRKRTAEKKNRDGHDVPFEVITDMKCRFHLPRKDDGLFDEIKFTELDEKNATKTAQDYHGDGRRARERGHDTGPPNKRQRFDRQRYGGHGYDNRDKRRDYSGQRGGKRPYYPRDRYGSPRGGGGYYGGGGYSGGGYGGGFSSSRPPPRSSPSDPYRRQGPSSGGFRQQSSYGSYGSYGSGSGGSSRGGSRGSSYSSSSSRGGRGGWSQGFGGSQGYGGYYQQGSYGGSYGSYGSSYGGSYGY